MDNHFSKVLAYSRCTRGRLYKVAGWSLYFIKDHVMGLLCIIPVFFLLMLSGCSQGSSVDKETFTQSAKPEIIQLSPKKPVRIELKRSAKSEYSWEVKGDDVEDIIKADSRLKEYMGEHDKGVKK